MKSFKFFFILSLFSFRFFHIDAQVVYSNSYPFHLESDIQFNDTINGFSIENPNNHPVSFYLDINHLFPLDENRMLSFIEALANQKNIPLEQATWVWVRENTFFNPPYTSERWQHNPLIFLNSIGGGLCDDIASVLTSLWKSQGFNAHIINLNGHVVSEVFGGERWEMFDASFGIVYRDKDGHVMSIKDIEDLPDTFTITDNNNEINPTFIGDNQIAHYLLEAYLSKEDNLDVTNWHLTYQLTSTLFVLPSRSTLIFTYDKANRYYDAFVRLTDESKGLLQIPLVPYSAKGNCSLIYDNRIHDVHANYFFPQDGYIGNMEINEVVKLSEINYLLNQRLNFIYEKKNNLIEIKADDTLIIKPYYQVNGIDLFFGEAGLFFKQKRKQYRNFIISLSDYKNDTIDKDFLLRMYMLFLEDDKTLDNEDRVRLKHKLLEDYDELNFLMKEKHSNLFIQFYPKSIYYFFFVSRFDKLPLFVDYINAFELN